MMYVCVRHVSHIPLVREKGSSHAVYPLYHGRDDRHRHDRGVLSHRRAVPEWWAELALPYVGEVVPQCI